MYLESLKLPAYNYKTNEIDGKTYIFDIVRKKYLMLTPEEWVRQHFVNLLINYYNYPKSLIRIEGGIKYNKLAKRTDIVVYNENSPHILVECKAPEIVLNQLVIEQAARYNKVLQTPFVIITNGMQTFCFEIDFKTNSFTQLKDIPLYQNELFNKNIEL